MDRRSGGGKSLCVPFNSVSCISAVKISIAISHYLLDRPRFGLRLILLFSLFLNPNGDLMEEV
jgi:hypothetical protein